MRRDEFMNALRQKIAPLSEGERDMAMDYYNEMIADKLEAGMDEEEVIAQFGPVEEIADKLIAESEGGAKKEPAAPPPQTPPTGDPRPQMGGQAPFTAPRPPYGAPPAGNYGAPPYGQPYAPPPPRQKEDSQVLKIVLLAVTSPIWASLALAVGMVVLALLFAGWVMVLSLFVMSFAFLAAGFIYLVPSFALLAQNTVIGAFQIGICLLFAGFAILSFLGGWGLAKAMMKGCSALFGWLGSIGKKRKGAAVNEAH
ncbi:DUF1700 domain-containing protein [Bittarella massiliensis (ex Durand et al. 2017)]|uniref:DUF1700 domain-containing protein n=1 Tax=Bittarella massiliensis (ex Durand et al. 2017) TaxID=1720313 RepID=UPI000A7C34DA|nr:hypothetical protein [Bittarella massiliensis (ex Durand et al. 2017)]